MLIQAYNLIINRTARSLNIIEFNKCNLKFQKNTNTLAKHNISYLQNKINSQKQYIKISKKKLHIFASICKIKYISEKV